MGDVRLLCVKDKGCLAVIVARILTVMILFNHSYTYAPRPWKAIPQELPRADHLMKGYPMVADGLSDKCLFYRSRSP